MPIIKSEKKYIVQSAKDKGDFVQVKLKNEKSILIPLEDYFMMAIKINSAISEEVVYEYTRKQNAYQAYIRVKSRLSNKDYTMYEIKMYCFKTLKCSEEEVYIVLDLVEKSGLVDDRKYALDKSIYYQDSGMSINEIRNKLKKVGISSNYIEEALSLLSEEKEYENACGMAKKLQLTIKGKSLAQQKMTLIQKLVQKGFSYDCANSAIETLTFDQDDSYAFMQTLNKAKRLYAKESEDKKINKIRMYCLRKGFSLTQINEGLEGGE